uniref:Uncharacterized protein n=1 Tax=Wuchereria bancrofti TaxID=6293 RepID=A0AAF5RVX1_WUCBA
MELYGKKPPVELNYEETTEWLKQQKSDIGKQIIKKKILIAELEAIINERPLVDIEEIGLVLKPGDFLNPGSARGEHLTEDNVYRKDKTICREENLQIHALAHQYKKNTCKRIDHLWKTWREIWLFKWLSYPHSEKKENECRGDKKEKFSMLSH